MVEKREEKNKKIEDNIRKEVHKEKRNNVSKKIFKIIFSMILIFILIILYMHFIGTYGLVVREYKVESNNLPASFHGFKIVQFSDINYPTKDEKEIKKVVSKINELKPDIVVFTGDLISEDKDLDDNTIKSLSKILNKINASIGIYAIKGEKDYNKYYDEVINNTKFKTINNSYEVIYYKENTPILLTGVGSLIKDECDIDQAFSYNELDNVYTISLVHEPDITVNILSKYKTDLILAGHSHNGQIRIPKIGGLVNFEEAKTYTNPKYDLGNTTLFISGGIGTSKYDFRLFNHPSINLYRLVKGTN